MLSPVEVLAREIAEERSGLKKFVDDRRVDGGINFNSDEIVEFNRRNEALGPKVERLKALQQIEQVAERNATDLAELDRVQRRSPHATPARGHDGASTAGDLDTRGFGDRFVETRAFKSFGGGVGPTAQIEGFDVRTVMSTGQGFAPEIVRNRPILLSPQRKIVLIDVVPSRPLSQPGHKYMEETTYTNTAAELAQSTDAVAQVYPAGALVFSEKTAVVQKIAVYVPVTDEQLFDVAYIRQYLNDRLGLMLRQRLESQMLNGNGTDPNLLGIYNFTGRTADIVRGTDPETDSIIKAVTAIQIGPYADPDLLVIHPTNWMNIRLLKTTTNEYVFGNPDQTTGPSNLWGLQPVTTPIATLGSAVVQDSTFLELAVYKNVDVQISNSHNDFFIQGKQAVRADIRVAFVSYRKAATCLVTGLR